MLLNIKLLSREMMMDVRSKNMPVNDDGLIIAEWKPIKNGNRMKIK